jgi:RHS repeat-associated protein
VHKASEVPSHDEDGNQTGDGRWHYRWDAENRLVEMETTTAATTAGAPYAKVRWTYDPLGRRIQRQSWQGANPVVVTKYVYDGWQCIAELDGSNVVTATYAWGKDLSGSRTGAGGVGGLLWVHHSQHGRHCYAYDGNGNVCGLTSATDGTRSGGYEYDPFGGVIRVDAGNPVVSWNEWQFSTKRKDGVAEVVLYEYRGYDVRTGRWLGRDPIGERGGIHIFGFVANLPVEQIDRLGLLSTEGHLTDLVADDCTLSLIVGHMRGTGLEALDKFLGFGGPRTCSVARIGFQTCGSDYLTDHLPEVNRFPLPPEVWNRDSTSHITEEEQKSVNDRKNSLPNLRHLPNINNENAKTANWNLRELVNLVNYAKANACKGVCCPTVKVFFICDPTSSETVDENLAGFRGSPRDIYAGFENPCGKMLTIKCD